MEKRCFVISLSNFIKNNDEWNTCKALANGRYSVHRGRSGGVNFALAKEGNRLDGFPLNIINDSSLNALIRCIFRWRRESIFCCLSNHQNILVEILASLFPEQKSRVKIVLKV